MFLDAQKERAQGNDDIELPDVPMEYVVLSYRRRLKMTYQEVRALPARRFLRDLEMLDLEATYGPDSIKPPMPSKGSMQ